MSQAMVAAASDTVHECSWILSTVDESGTCNQPLHVWLDCQSPTVACTPNNGPSPLPLTKQAFPGCMHTNVCPLWVRRVVPIANACCLLSRSSSAHLTLPAVRHRCMSKHAEVSKSTVSVVVCLLPLEVCTQAHIRQWWPQHAQGVQHAKALAHTFSCLVRSCLYQLACFQLSCHCGNKKLQPDVTTDLKDGGQAQGCSTRL